MDEVGGPVSKEDVGQQAAPEKEAVLPATEVGWIGTGSHQDYDGDIQRATVIGDKITEEDRMVHLLASLPDSYCVLVTAQEACAEVPKLETVTERLLHEERKLADGESSHRNDGEKVMAARCQKS